MKQESNLRPKSLNRICDVQSNRVRMNRKVDLSGRENSSVRTASNAQILVQNGDFVLLARFSIKFLIEKIWHNNIDAENNKNA